MSGLDHPQCPCCDSNNINVFHPSHDVPVNSVLLLESREEAIGFPTGDIVLGICLNCGFIYNTAFDPTLLEYSERYDPTQAYSETFNRWHRNLADQLVERYKLHNKRVLEIGCGKGEFLTMLCQIGNNHGIGFDPAYTTDSRRSQATERIEFVTDFYSEKYAHHKADFVCCKMTLEHIQPTSEFVGTVRRTVGEDKETVIFFQVPDVLRILQETAFWDIYYEHCSYFSLGSLARLFRKNGFEIVDLAREYDDQYIMIEARPTILNGSMRQLNREKLPQEDDLEELVKLTEQFSEKFARLRQQWHQRLSSYKAQRRRVVVWGSGSKGVAFLTTLGIEDSIDFVVDINPNRQGYFMAKTGQEIVSPAFLKTYQPDVVVVMNPIYRDEIKGELDGIGLAPEIITT